MVIVVALGATACTDSQPETARERFVEEFVGGALPDASEFQAEILADGDVDFEEYERSVLATLACLREEGLETFGPTLQPDNTYSYGYRGVAEDGTLLPDSVVNAKFDLCYARYGELVDSVWFAKQAEQVFDASQEVKDAYVDCFAAHGVTIPRDLHITDIYRVLAEEPAVAPCEGVGR